MIISLLITIAVPQFLGVIRWRCYLDQQELSTKERLCYICITILILIGSPFYLMYQKFYLFYLEMKLGKNYYTDGMHANSSGKHSNYISWGRANLGPKLDPGVGFFEPWFFIILKNSHQDLSNEGSNFIMGPLEVGNWVAQTREESIRKGFDSRFLPWQWLVWQL